MVQILTPWGDPWPGNGPPVRLFFVKLLWPLVLDYPVYANLGSIFQVQHRKRFDHLCVCRVYGTFQQIMFSVHCNRTKTLLCSGMCRTCKRSVLRSFLWTCEHELCRNCVVHQSTSLCCIHEHSDLEMVWTETVRPVQLHSGLLIKTLVLTVENPLSASAQNLQET